MWDRQGGLESHVEILNVTFHLKHKLELEYREIHTGREVKVTIDLSKHIARTDDGDLEYVDEPSMIFSLPILPTVLSD